MGAALVWSLSCLEPAPPTALPGSQGADPNHNPAPPPFLGRPLLIMIALSVLAGGAYVYTRPSLPSSLPSTNGGGGGDALGYGGEAAHRRRGTVEDRHLDTYHEHQEAMAHEPHRDQQQQRGGQFHVSELGG